MRSRTASTHTAPGKQQMLDRVQLYLRTTIASLIRARAESYRWKHNDSYAWMKFLGAREKPKMGEHRRRGSLRTFLLLSPPTPSAGMKWSCLRMNAFWNVLELKGYWKEWSRRHGPTDSSLRSLLLWLTMEYLSLIRSGYLQLHKLRKDYREESRHFTSSCKPSDIKKSEMVRSAWVYNGFLYDGCEKAGYLENKHRWSGISEFCLSSHCF